MRAIMSAMLVVIAGSGVLWKATDGLRAITAESARRISITAKQPAVPDTILETMSGTSTSLIDDRGRVTLVEFIYTQCPTICQTAGMQLAQLRDQLESLNLADRARILSVSFDPSRDDIPALASYGDAHGADGAIWTVARPAEPDLSKLLKTFGVVVIPDSLGGYEHNAALHVLSPSGKLVAILDIDDLNGAIRAIAGPAS